MTGSDPTNTTVTTLTDNVRTSSIPDQTRSGGS